MQTQLENLVFLGLDSRPQFSPDLGGSMTIQTIVCIFVIIGLNYCNCDDLQELKNEFNEFKTLALDKFEKLEGENKVLKSKLDLCDQDGTERSKA